MAGGLLVGLMIAFAGICNVATKLVKWKQR
jgi:hypothetical protein